jgi:hypothetical protein
MFHNLFKRPPMRVFRMLFNRRLAVVIPISLLLLLLLPLSAFAAHNPDHRGLLEHETHHQARDGGLSNDLTPDQAWQLANIALCTGDLAGGNPVSRPCLGTYLFDAEQSLTLTQCSLRYGLAVCSGVKSPSQESQPTRIPPTEPAPEPTPSQSTLPSNYYSPSCSGQCAAR